MPVPDNNVDALREQLKSLGYLDAGVDRFVLGGATERRGPIGVAARTSARVGLLGGALLGPAAALGLSARLPGLVSGGRDAMVAALYLSILFFAATVTASFLVSLAAAELARARDERFAARARQASRAAAWIFTIGSLVYLTLWWRNANAGFGWSAPAWTSFALLVAVTISLLLGHAVRMATLAVLAARSHRGSLPAVPARSWRVVLGGGALAFAGAASLLLTTVRADAEGARPRAPLTVVNSRAPIRLIAIDGFDPATYERLEPRLPHIHQAFGSLVVPLQAQDTSDPARAWTTIATGVAPDVHGVHAMETRRVAGLSGAFSSGGRLQVIGIATDLLRLTRPSVASAQDRKVKTLWDVAEEAGLRTAVVNWWATWPAASGSALMITDRGVVRLEHGGPLDGEIGPPPLYGALREAWPGVRAEAATRAATAFANVTNPAIAATLRRSAELDATLIGLLQSLPPPPRDLDVIYLPGLDIAQNSLFATTDTASASLVASRIDALEKYYVFLDQAIAPLLDAGGRTTIGVITQPGRVRSASGGLFALWPASHGSDGDAVPSSESRRVSAEAGPSALDVAPTILHALGLPVSRELTGKALPELLGAASVAGERFVATYGRPSTATSLSAGQPLDQETIDRLRSLGYIK